MGADEGLAPSSGVAIGEAGRGARWGVYSHNLCFNPNVHFLTARSRRQGWEGPTKCKGAYNDLAGGGSYKGKTKKGLRAFTAASKQSSKTAIRTM